MSCEHCGAPLHADVLGCEYCGDGQRKTSLPKWDYTSVEEDYIASVEPFGKQIFAVFLVPLVIGMLAIIGFFYWLR